MIPEHVDGRKVARALMGEGRGAEWFEAGPLETIVYHRLEPMDYLALYNSNGREVERRFIRYCQRVVWL